MKIHPRPRSRASLWFPCSSRVTILCALWLVTSGCELLGLSDPDVPQAPPTTPTAPPVDTPPPVTPAVTEEAEVPYERPRYPENTGRNPFQPVPEVVAPIGVAQVEESRPIEELEKYSIAQLVLTGIISETAVPRAMFIDPDGFGHIVKEGDRIGRQGGIISDIRDNEVDIQESSSEEAAAKSIVQTIRLSETELAVPQDDDSLSDAEREALEQLLKSEGGRRQLRESLRNQIEREGRSADANQAAGGGIAPPTP